MGSCHHRIAAIWRACAMALAALALLLAGCGPEGTSERRAGGQADQTEAAQDQVNRAHKANALQRLVRDAAEAFDRAIHGDAMPHVSAENRSGLRGFYARLAALESGARREPLTVLHLGDSHIASDRFTGDLRMLFQARFGDAGRGMMMPGFPFAYYRAQGARFAKSGAWTAASSLNGDPGPYGLTGVRLATEEADAWLSLTSESGAFDAAAVSLVAGPRQGTAVISIDGAETEVATRAETQDIRTVQLQHKGSRLAVRAKGDGEIAVLSWAVRRDRPGLRYVNLGIPSATADITRRWDDAIVAADIARLAPDLIVLGYGTNEGFDDRLDVAAYEARYGAMIRKLSRMSPSSAFIVIGPPDGARMPGFARKDRESQDLKQVECRQLDRAEVQGYGDLIAAGDQRLARWHPPPKLDPVRRALERVATRADALYWDWSRVMNGPCGIHDWVLAEPALAVSDHVHITAAGSGRSAEALFRELMTGYDAHNRLASR